MDSNFYTLDGIPNEKDDPEFWTLLGNVKLKSVINFLIINEIRKYDVEKLGDLQCRTQLAKIKAWQELIDFPKAILERDKNEGNEKLDTDGLD